MQNFTYEVETKMGCPGGNSVTKANVAQNTAIKYGYILILRDVFLNSAGGSQIHSNQLWVNISNLDVFWFPVVPPATA